MKHKLQQEDRKDSSSLTRDILMDVLKQNDSIALALAEQAMEEGMDQMAESQGALLCPEGSAIYLGLKKLIEKDWLNNEEIELGVNISVG